MSRDDDLSALANTIRSAIEKARHLQLPTSAYVLTMALIEVMQEKDAIEPRHEGDTTL
jgi:hypothetical protein